jgi:mannose-6-phosphate isomerase
VIAPIYLTSNQLGSGRNTFSNFGSDSMLLVKLLDAGQRLPIHVHPNRRFAAEHLGRRHGKAEAWYILDGGTVHLGFKRDVEREELDSWMSGQDSQAMLEAMHEVSVTAGDGVYIPPGLPHAIGAGVFLLELQEPEDLSILLEWKGFNIDGAADGNLGLGFTTALQAAGRRQYTEQELQGLVTRADGEGAPFPIGSEEYFRAERVDVSSRVALDQGFSILVVVEGQGTLTTGNATSSALTRGDTVLVPYSAGAVEITGGLRLLRCRPPETPAQSLGR